jgi:cyclase
MRATSVAMYGMVGAGLLCRIMPVAAQVRQPGAEHTPPAFTFHKIRNDVYHAVGTGSMAVGANAAIVINDADVLLVDSHVSPAAAQVLLEELKAITNKPVRYVVNTHFHFDHTHGNQIYPASVEIISHQFTRDAMAGGASMRGRGYSRFIGTLPQQIATLRSQLDTASTPATRADLERRIRIQENYRAATAAVRPTPPSVAFDTRLTLYRGGREIRLLFFGRGHTSGDVVVHLPGERVLITGDLLTAGLSYMGDAFVPDWIETLERLKPLQFDVILPGHGLPVQRERIDHFQAYLTDFWGKVVPLQRAGVAAEEAARRIDMRNHATNYPTIRAAGVDVDAVHRAYEILTQADRNDRLR